MKLPRVRLGWPRRRPSEAARPEDVVLPGKTAGKPNHDDSRLLRRTRLRLMAVSGLVTLLILIVLEGTVYAAAGSFFANDSIDRLRSFAEFCKPALTGQPPSQGSPREFELEYGTSYAGLLVFGVDSEGGTSIRTRYLPPGLPVQAGLDAVAHGGSDTREVTVSGVPVRVYTTSFRGPNGDTYIIQTAVDRTDEVNLLGLLQRIFIGGGLLALLAALLAGYLYAGRALVPIRDSIARRQAALQRQREFTANASHELRAPLTVMRASVEDLRRNRRKRVDEVGDALGDIEDEVRTVTALVDDMLLLARTDSGAVQLERVPLDLSDEAAEATSLLSALGLERGVAVMLDPLPAPITGDPVRLRQLVTILLDNAVRHSPPGSTVEVRVQPDEGGALLEVLDTGPGIKPEDMPRLWDRFWRADDAPAGGTGLGLAIAKWIVEQHGGTIGAENRPEGGARFWARLPGVRPGEKATEAGTKTVEGTPEAGSEPAAGDRPAS